MKLATTTADFGRWAVTYEEIVKMIGLFNTSINLVLLLSVKYGVRRATDGEISLF